jgi:cytochrome c553
MGSGWRAFRLAFLAALVDAGISPTCGARLPDGPQRTDLSQCQRAGLLTGVNLHLHHEPALTTAERQDQAKVQDARRIILLCASCHAALAHQPTRSAPTMSQLDGGRENV